MSKTKDLEQTVIFEGVTPEQLYEALMDSKLHAKFTGGEAEISREIGGESTAYDGWVQAINVELVPNKKIVQKWRGSDWPQGHFSKATFIFSKVKNGTALSFKQTGVPEDKYDDIADGWQTEYWEKMKNMFDRR